MSTNTKTAIEREGRPRAGVSRSEPGGRAQRDAGGARAAGASVEQLPVEVRERLGDELIDELLAGARSEEEIVGPGGLLADLTRRLRGARDGRRADRAPRLCARPAAAGWGREYAQRDDAEDAGDPARAGSDRGAPRSQGQLCAADRAEGQAPLRRL